MWLAVYSLVLDGGVKSTVKENKFGGFKIPVKILSATKLIVPFSGRVR